MCGCIEKQELSNCFTNVHPVIKFTREEENDNRIAFLHVLLTRRIDGSMKWDVFPKNTWMGHYTYFYRFTPFQHKINLAKCLNRRIKRLCSENSIDNGIVKLKYILRDNGNPDNFVKEFQMGSKIKIKNSDMVNKKNPCFKLDFEGDIMGEILTHRSKRSVERHFRPPNYT